MKKKKLKNPVTRKMSADHHRLVRAGQITTTKLALDSLRDEMLKNVSTWSYTKMKAALEQCIKLNSELKKLMR